VNALRPLYVTATVLTVTGLALRLVPIGRPAIAPPTSPEASDRHRSVTLPVQTATGGIDSAAVDPIVLANIFARSRAAPTRAGAAHVAADRRPAPAPHAQTFTLYGTTIGPLGAVALIDAGDLPRGAHMHHLGDEVAGARLVAITDSTVTLDRRSGPLVLHLPRTAGQTP
jgi:hypothetical protein